MPTLLTLGARRLGRVVLERFAARGWDVAAVARTERTLAEVRERHPGAWTRAADAGDPGALRAAVRDAVSRFGSIDLAVNAVSPAREGVETSGALHELGPDALDPYAGALLPAVFQFFRVAGAVMAGAGRGTLVQVTGGSARRARAGLGPWACGAAGSRALAHAAALELRPLGVHAALLVVDGAIDFGGGEDRSAGTVDAASVADAVAALHGQPPRAWTHELTLTPAGERWVP